MAQLREITEAHKHHRTTEAYEVICTINNVYTVISTNTALK